MEREGTFTKQGAKGPGPSIAFGRREQLLYNLAVGARDGRAERFSNTQKMIRRIDVGHREPTVLVQTLCLS